MGCQSCKSNNSNSITNSLPSELTSNNILFRVIAFFCVAIAIPFILLILLGQLFVAFFLPNLYGKISDKVTLFYTNFIRNAQIGRMEKDVEKREQQFKNNEGYEEGSKLLDIEVYEENNEMNKEDE